MTWETIKLAKLPLSFSKEEAFNIEREQIKRGGFQIRKKSWVLAHVFTEMVVRRRVDSCQESQSPVCTKDPTSRLISNQIGKTIEKKRSTYIIQVKIDKVTKAFLPLKNKVTYIVFVLD